MMEEFEEWSSGHHHKLDPPNRMSEPRNDIPPPTHKKVTSTVHHQLTPERREPKEDDCHLDKTRAPDGIEEKAIQIIQELYQRVQTLKGRVATKERYQPEHTSQATSKSLSRRETRKERSPDQCHGKRQNHSISRESELHHDDEDRRHHRDSK
ncbi:uncharacterized protein DS421_11g333980 [Arachis hypogaea]|nr:uncharacterized protein DS421_11g333980 [Arachis hypogaea]